jgi:hypothetical protein
MCRIDAEDPCFSGRAQRITDGPGDAFGVAVMRIVDD